MKITSGFAYALGHKTTIKHRTLDNLNLGHRPQERKNHNAIYLSFSLHWRLLSGILSMKSFMCSSWNLKQILNPLGLSAKRMCRWEASVTALLKETQKEAESFHTKSFCYVSLFVCFCFVFVFINFCFYKKANNFMESILYSFGVITHTLSQLNKYCFFSN